MKSSPRAHDPTLLRHVKADIGLHRDETGRFLITGSQDFSLMEGVTESLAGRSAVLTLHSLSAREYEVWSGESLDRGAMVPNNSIRGLGRGGRSSRGGDRVVGGQHGVLANQS
jgi:hypothetical protein